MNPLNLLKVLAVKVVVAAMSGFFGPTAMSGFFEKTAMSGLLVKQPWEEREISNV